MNPITDVVLGGLGKVIDNFFPSAEEKARAELLKAQVVTEMNASIQRQIDSQVSVIVAEAQSKSWLTNSWRPILMLSFTAIIVNNYILYPYLSAFWHGAPLLPIPVDLWDLLKIGVGGYVVGRSAEKIMDTHTSGNVAVAKATTSPQTIGSNGG